MTASGSALDVEVGAGLTEPARCRRLLREHVASAAPEVDVELLLLLASELVTNAVVHGGPPRRLVLRPGPGAAFRLEVSDGGPGLPVVLPREPGSEHGRGMQLVSGLTDRWGVSPNGAGKTVWTEVDA